MKARKVTKYAKLKLIYYKYKIKKTEAELKAHDF